MIKVEDLNKNIVSDLSIESGSIVIDLNANDVDIKTNKDKLCIVLKKKTAQEI